MTEKEIIEDFLKNKPGYLKSGNLRIKNMLNASYPFRAFHIEDIKYAKKKIRKSGVKTKELKPDRKLIQKFNEMARELGLSDMVYESYKEEPCQNITLKKKAKKRNIPNTFNGGDPNNILVIGDLHEPFCLDDYLSFCREQQEKFNCGTVIFIGDIIDNHYSSYHESDPDGYSAGQELELAIDRISEWYSVFPKATVIIGNHDRLVHRKAYSGNVSKRWVRNFDEVLNTPNWDFVENIELFGINFNHGEGGTARTRMKNELQSQVQGHLHSQFYVEFLAGMNFLVFGLQVGCGIDREAYAMAYGKNYKKPIIGCGVILNKGTLPLAIPMKM